MDKNKDLLQVITDGIQEKKGSNIVIADLTDINTTLCNYLIICQGNSPAQVEAIAGSIGKFARDKADEKPIAVDGLKNAEWIALDYVDVMVHVFLPETREFYDLEHLWADARLTSIANLD
ncbi:MAG: ribosome silencing factor [Bacteroidaceae bacterium]